jgi:hypothetical protein
MDFEETSRLASRIKKEVLVRRMPPWPAAPGFGDFSNDTSLTPYETQLLVSWAEGGTPRGGSELPADSLKSVAPPAGDLVLQPDADTPVRSRRQRYVLKTNEKTDRWIRGWEFRPGNRALVRQARITIASSGEIGTWIPSMETVFLPAGVGRRLQRGAQLILDIEYARPEAPATDRSSLGLFFSSDGELRELKRMALSRGSVDIQEDVTVFALRPQLEDAGESIRVVAYRPDGRVEPLLWVRHYDPAFQLTYQLRRPVTLPKGARISVFSFDETSTVGLDYLLGEIQEGSATGMTKGTTATLPRR